MQVTLLSDIVIQLRNCAHKNSYRSVEQVISVSCVCACVWLLYQNWLWTCDSDSARPKSVPYFLSKWQLVLPDILKFSWQMIKARKSHYCRFSSGWWASIVMAISLQGFHLVTAWFRHEKCQLFLLSRGHFCAMLCPALHKITSVIFRLARCHM